MYHLLKYHKPFAESSAAEYDRQWQEREHKYLQRKAAKLGFTLTPRSVIATAAGQVSQQRQCAEAPRTPDRQWSDLTAAFSLRVDGRDRALWG